MERDIVIVGGGPAGVTTALSLVAADARLASRIVILEKSVYPRDKYCAGGLGGRGVRLLRELGAMPVVPFAPIDGVSFRGLTGEITARVPNIGRVVRRIEFDHALAKTAMERGVAIEEGVKVGSVSVEGDLARSGYATVETDRGVRRARVIVGADGVGSAIRKSMGLGSGVLRAQVLEIDTEGVLGDPDPRLVRFDGSDPRIRGYTWEFPTVIDGEAKVSRGIYMLRGEEGGADIAELFGERLRAQGLDLKSYKNKRFAERGYDPHEKLSDVHRMLVGESAGIDPVTGEGIAQAIEYGVLAGRFLATAIRANWHRPDVRGWSDEFRRSRLAFDLRVRRSIVPLFYGPHRRSIERFLFAEPDALFLGCQHFGGLPYDRAKLLGMAVKSGAFVARKLVARGLAR